MSNVLAPWRSPLSRALHRNRSQPFSRYLQLATITPEGYPANRTVVFRGFTPQGNKLKIITDVRSEKFQQLHHCPWGEICWYFSQTREQFRLFGSIQVIDAHSPDATGQQWRLETWQSLSEAARLQLAWPTPKAPREPNPEAFRPPPPSPEMPLPTFCLLCLSPQRVEHLELRGEPQNRWLFWLDEENLWQQQGVNP